MFVRWAQDHMRELFRSLHRAEEQSFIVACSDEATALTASTAKVTFRMPWAFRLYTLTASLTTAQTSGSIFTVDDSLAAHFEHTVAITEEGPRVLTLAHGDSIVNRPI